MFSGIVLKFEFIFVLYLVDVKENFAVLLPFLHSFHLGFCFLFVVAFYLPSGTFDFKTTGPTNKGTGHFQNIG